MKQSKLLKTFVAIAVMFFAFGSVSANVATLPFQADARGWVADGLPQGVTLSATGTGSEADTGRVLNAIGGFIQVEFEGTGYDKLFEAVFRMTANSNVGSVVTVFESADGTTWTAVDSVTGVQAGSAGPANACLEGNIVRIPNTGQALIFSSQSSVNWSIFQARLSPEARFVRFQLTQRPATVNAVIYAIGVRQAYMGAVLATNFSTLENVTTAQTIPGGQIQFSSAQLNAAGNRPQVCAVPAINHWWVFNAGDANILVTLTDPITERGSIDLDIIQTNNSLVPVIVQYRVVGATEWITINNYGFTFPAVTARPTSFNFPAVAEGIEAFRVVRTGGVHRSGNGVSVGNQTFSVAGVSIFQNNFVATAPGAPVVNSIAVSTETVGIADRTLTGAGPWTFWVFNGASTSTFEIDAEDYTTKTVYSSRTGVMTDNAGVFTVEMPADVDVVYDIITITLDAGTTYEVVRTLRFEKDRVVPTATADPATGAAIAQEGNIVLTFNRNVTRTGNVLINSEVANDQVTVVDNVVTISRTAAHWTGETELVLNIPMGTFQSVYGNSNTAAIALTYTALFPTVVSAIPYNPVVAGYLLVEDADLNITFSQPITAIDATLITATYVDGDPIPSTNFEASFDGTVLTITFATLTGDTEVEVTLAAGAVTGNSGWSNEEWYETFEVFDPFATPDILNITFINPETGLPATLQGATTWSALTASLEFARTDIIRNTAINITVTGGDYILTEDGTENTIRLDSLEWNTTYTLTIPAGAWHVDGQTDLLSDEQIITFTTRQERPSDSWVVLAISSIQTGTSGGTPYNFRAINADGTSFGELTGDRVFGHGFGGTPAAFTNTAFNTANINANSHTILFNSMLGPITSFTDGGVAERRRSNSGNQGYTFNIVSSGFEAIGLFVSTGGNTDHREVWLNATQSVSVASNLAGPWTPIAPYHATNNPRGFKVDTGYAVGANVVSDAVDPIRPLLIYNLSIPAGRYLRIRTQMATGTAQFVGAFFVPMDARPQDLEGITVAAVYPIPSQTFEGAGPHTFWLQSHEQYLPEVTPNVLDGFEDEVNITMTSRVTGGTITSTTDVELGAGIYSDTITIRVALRTDATQYELYTVIFHRDTVLPRILSVVPAEGYIPNADTIVVTFNKAMVATVPLNEVVTINGTPATGVTLSGAVLRIPYAATDWDVAYEMVVEIIAGTLRDRVFETNETVTLNFERDFSPPVLQNALTGGQNLHGAEDLPTLFNVNLVFSRSDVERVPGTYITLNGQNIEVEGLNFALSGLDFNTTYTLTVPAGAFRVVSDHALLSNAFAATFETGGFRVTLGAYRQITGVPGGNFRAFRRIENGEWARGLHAYTGDTIWFFTRTNHGTDEEPDFEFNAHGGGNLNTANAPSNHAMFGAMMGPNRFNFAATSLTAPFNDNELTFANDQVFADAKARLTNGAAAQFIFRLESSDATEIHMNFVRGSGSFAPGNRIGQIIESVEVSNVFSEADWFWAPVSFTGNTGLDSIDIRGLEDVATAGPFILSARDFYVLDGGPDVVNPVRQGATIPQGVFVRIRLTSSNQLAEAQITPSDAFVAASYRITSVTYTNAAGDVIQGSQYAPTAFVASVNFGSHGLMMRNTDVIILLNGNPISEEDIRHNLISISDLAMDENHTLTIPAGAWISTVNPTWQSQAQTITFRTGEQVTSIITPEDIPVVELVSIFPNPVSDILYVDATNAELIEIMDMLGRTVLRQAATSGIQSINVSDLREGLYFIRVTMTNGETAVMRFVKN